ncbi:hypothetical protein SAMN05428978_1005122 [Nitrosomonas sp. Nm34]|nr:hypothetical protein SAMN05428978_1005122 [Nitrosomonas sp. Nm34]
MSEILLEMNIAGTFSYLDVGNIVIWIAIAITGFHNVGYNNLYMCLSTTNLTFVS